jgi:hypothetical protein
MCTKSSIQIPHLEPIGYTTWPPELSKSLISQLQKNNLSEAEATSPQLSNNDV